MCLCADVMRKEIEWRGSDVVRTEATFVGVRDSTLTIVLDPT